MYDKVAVGNRILKARIDRNLKQSEICRIMKISQATYSNIESGKRVLDGEEMFQLSEILGVPVQWILGIGVDDNFSHSEQLRIEEFKRYIISTRK